MKGARRALVRAREQVWVLVLACRPRLVRVRGRILVVMTHQGCISHTTA